MSFSNIHPEQIPESERHPILKFEVNKPVFVLHTKEPMILYSNKIANDCRQSPIGWFFRLDCKYLDVVDDKLVTSEDVVSIATSSVSLITDLKNKYGSSSSFISKASMITKRNVNGKYQFTVEKLPKDMDELVKFILKNNR